MSRRAHSPTRCGRAESGFGLVDVLIALVVLSIGVLGIARLLAMGFREADQIRERALAARLAQEKIEDLRGYVQIEAGGAGLFGFDEIAGDAGGSEQGDGALRLPPGAVTVSGIEFERHWRVTQPGEGYKQVTVTLGWTARDGSSAQLSLDSAIAAFEPALASRGLLRTASTARPRGGPFAPEDEPGVVDIDVDGGQRQRGRLRPLAAADAVPGFEVMEIETLRYLVDGPLLQRRQTRVVACSCVQAGVGTALNLHGEPVTRRVGRPAADGQPAECATCCRDHHDDASCLRGATDGKPDCLDPWRPTDDYHEDDHRHYDALGAPADDEGDVYHEACRLQRADGELRVAQDLRLEALSVIPAAYFEEPGGADRYSDHVRAQVLARLQGSALPAPVWPQPATVGSGTVVAFQARGLYLDFLTEPQKADYAAHILRGDTRVYQQIPFTEVDLSARAHWSSSQGEACHEPASAAECVMEVGDGSVRGLRAGSASLRAELRRGNSGLTGEAPTDPDDALPLESAQGLRVP